MNTNDHEVETNGSIATSPIETFDQEETIQVRSLIKVAVQ
jgi:hypothetical protein